MSSVGLSSCARGQAQLLQCSVAFPRNLREIERLDKGSRFSSLTAEALVPLIRV